MTVYQFVISGANTTVIPLRSRVSHQFSGKRVEMKLLTLQFRSTESGSFKFYPKYPLRLDMTQGFTSDTGTAFAPDGNLLDLKASSSRLGFMFTNANCDLHITDLNYRGFCLGNVWELQLNLGNLAPGEGVSPGYAPIPDITEFVDTCILTVDVKEI